MSMRTPERSSVVRNTVLSYIGQAYAVLIGIVIMPFYLGHLGAEAYGLIGFFAVLQAWLLLLDVGLSPSLVRQIAHYQGDTPAQIQQRRPGQLVRSFELIFLPLALLSSLSVWAASQWIAQRWLKAQELDTATIVSCIALMGLMVAFKLYSTLYKSAIQGMELHPWLNGANIFIATVRYVGGLFLVVYLSQNPLDFFIFQAAVGFFELLIFAVKAYLLMPPPSLFSGFNWAIVKPIVPFAASMSLTSMLWIVLTQMDKVLLSQVLLLKEYGYFSLVALISTGILMLVNPLVQTLLPRMTVLLAQNRSAEMHQLYLAANRLVGTFLLPLAMLIALHGEALLYAWSGNVEAAQWSRSILGWYALGSALMALSGFQFYLQYAYGKVRLHVWYSLVSALVTIPLMIFAVNNYGAAGAAMTWFLLRLVSFAIWPHLVHRRFAPEIHRQWLHDLLRISLMTCVGLLVSAPVFHAIASDNRFDTFLGLALSGLITVLLVAVSYKPLVLKIYLRFSKASI